MIKKVLLKLTKNPIKFFNFLKAKKKFYWEKFFLNFFVEIILNKQKLKS